MPVADLDELAQAYRRAKTDLFFSSDPRLEDLLIYEENLRQNLETLQARLEESDESWVGTEGFLGSYTLLPTAARVEGAEGQTLWSNATSTHQRATEEQIETAVAEFRLMSRCSIDLHVLSTLWMMTAGGKLEARLSRHAYGSRLRRNRHGQINTLAPGSFRPYLTPYRRWRDDGLSALKEAVDSGRAVTALTADATSFYHRLDARFLEHPRFLRSLSGIRLSVHERKIHRLFVHALAQWTRSVVEDAGWEADDTGIPVGLPASAVVANLALMELDDLIVEHLHPLYYGRYVDDLFLVVADGDEPGPVNVWRSLADRAGDSIRIESAHAGDGVADADSLDTEVVRFDRDYLGESQVAFSNRKNRLYHLSGPSGRFVLESVSRSIAQQTSEWRSLPVLPDDPEEVATSVAVAATAQGEPALSLGTADRITTRRAEFVIRLRDMEAHARHVELESWRPHLRSFFSAVCDHVFTVENYFALSKYLPKLVHLAATCGAWQELRSLFLALERLHVELSDNHWDWKFEVKHYSLGEPADRQKILDLWTSNLAQTVFEALAAGFSEPLSASQLRRTVRPLERIDPGISQRLRVRTLQALHARLFIRDLAAVPYRFCLLGPVGLAPDHGIPSDRRLEGVRRDIDVPLPRSVAQGLDLLALRMSERPRIRWADELAERNGSSIPGLAFATRPFTFTETYLVLHGRQGRRFGIPPARVIQAVLKATRGYSVTRGLPTIIRKKSDRSGRVINVRGPYDDGTRRIALSMIETSDDAVTAAALGRPKLDRKRFAEINSVVNEAIRRVPRAHYLVLPELSLPSSWFFSLLPPLSARGVNLVAGVEYLRRGRRTVHNQVWAALNVRGLGFPAPFVFPQDKQRAAVHELRQKGLRHLRLRPHVAWNEPPIIAHGSFRFALLICSELTNINYRASLRGEIDALFLPEWNQDIHSFNSLVESAALDIHAYVGQANHRRFGDSRIRSPAKDDWNRDVLRLRGGAHDYVVLADIDYRSLRQFQSRPRGEKGYFKPLPDGYEIAPERLEER